MQVQTQHERVAMWVGIAAALLPFLLLCAFNQPFFDDYRNAYWMREHGVLGVQRWAYLTWTGRFTSTFLMTVLNPVAYGWLDGVKVTAALFFLAHWAALAWLWRTLLRLGRNAPGSWTEALAPAGLLLALACNAMPAPFSFLYWFAGALVYQLPHLALLCFTALALRLGWEHSTMKTSPVLAAAACLVLAITGNELLLVQAAVVLAALGWALPSKARRAWLLWVLIGSIAAGIAVVAPGNWVRAEAMAPTDSAAHRLLLLLPRTALSALKLLASPVVSGSVLAALLLGLQLGWQRPATSRLRLAKKQWWALALAYAALNGSGFLLFVALIGTPLNRALNEMVLVGLVSTAALGYLLAQQLKRPAWVGRHHWLLPLLLLSLFVSGNTRLAWRELLTTAPAYEAQMQARNAALLAASKAKASTITLAALHLRHGRVLAPLNRCGNFTDFDIDLTPGCEGTINGVLARYYQLPQVCCTADNTGSNQ
ncbi:hypothetical protein GCM10023185_43430 [Hymenobacter saemangeumensis]|uniref:Uncharacterized protein n=1 Tax=Hymenobacter saemangeumensis TaxID=1084522 RepID=A0ABP8IRY7_9BACT